MVPSQHQSLATAGRRYQTSEIFPEKKKQLAATQKLLVLKNRYADLNATPDWFFPRHFNSVANALRSWFSKIAIAILHRLKKSPVFSVRVSENCQRNGFNSGEGGEKWKAKGGLDEMVKIEMDLTIDGSGNHLPQVESYVILTSRIERTERYLPMSSQKNSWLCVQEIHPTWKLEQHKNPAAKRECIGAPLSSLV